MGKSSSQQKREKPAKPKLKFIQMDDVAGEGFYCDPQTGLCYIDGQLVEDGTLIEGASSDDSTQS